MGYFKRMETERQEGYKPSINEHVYQIKICISGEVAVYHKTAPSWQRARHLAIVNAMKQYGKGFAEIFGCDYDVKQIVDKE